MHLREYIKRTAVFSLCFLTVSTPLVSAQKISLKFKDADIRDVMLILSEISGRNIIIHPDVKGKVTVSFNDVEWKDALEAILAINDLGYIEVGNQAYVSNYETMLRHAGRYESAAAGTVEAAREKVIFTLPLPLEKAKSIEPKIGHLFSKEGKYQYNLTTGCVIITDYRENTEKIMREIRKLIDDK